MALRKAAEREPDYGPVWSALATLYGQMYSVDAPGFDRPLETALRYARRGVYLEPGSQLARLILAYASYLSEDSAVFQQEIETALTLNPNSPYTVGTAGYFHVMRGDFELALQHRASAHRRVCARRPSKVEHERALRVEWEVATVELERISSDLELRLGMRGEVEAEGEIRDRSAVKHH